MSESRSLVLGVCTLAIVLGACSSNDGEVNRLEMQLETERQAVADQQAKVEAAATAATADKQRIDDLEARAETAESDAEAEKQKVADLEQDLAETEGELEDLESEISENAQREGLAKRHYYGLLAFGSSTRYLSGRNYSSQHSIGSDGSTLTLRFNDPQRMPVPDLERQADPPADQGVWKAEKFEQTWTAGDGGTHRDTAIIYRTEPDADSSYLYFGWWERGSTGGTRPSIEFIAIPSGAVGTDPISNIAVLQGTATYVGIAAGKHGVYNPLGGMNAGGSFTARATLNADFGNTGNIGTISGTIDEFVASGQSRDWSVELKEAPIDARGVYRNSQTGTRWTIAGEDTPSPLNTGWWGGSFRKPDADQAGAPNGVIGGFHATYRNVGRMTGSYGALKQ